MDLLQFSHEFSELYKMIASGSCWFIGLVYKSDKDNEAAYIGAAYSNHIHKIMDESILFL